MEPFESVDAQSFQPVLEALPPMAAIALGALVVLGVVLWLLGRSLARLACVISGLVLGGIAGLMAGQAFAEQGAFTLPLVLGGAIAGALLAGLLFRVWMGVSGAILLALVAPAASIIWTGATPPPIDFEAVEQQVNGDADEVDPRRPRDRDADEAADIENPITALLSTARGIYQSQVEGIRLWWDELGETARGVLIVAAMIGGAVGLLLGLMAPNIAASVQSALVGAILIFYPGRELLARFAPDQMGWLPHTPRATLLTLGLITLLGILIQWTLFRRRADN